MLDFFFFRKVMNIHEKSLKILNDPWQALTFRPLANVFVWRSNVFMRYFGQYFGHRLIYKSFKGIFKPTILTSIFKIPRTCSISLLSSQCSITKITNLSWNEHWHDLKFIFLIFFLFHAFHIRSVFCGFLIIYTSSAASNILDLNKR